MIIRNDTSRIFKGVNNRKARAATQGNTDKWFKLEALAWELLRKWLG